MKSYTDMVMSVSEMEEEILKLQKALKETKLFRNILLIIGAVIFLGAALIVIIPPHYTEAGVIMPMGGGIVLMMAAGFQRNRAVAIRLQIEEFERKIRLGTQEVELELQSHTCPYCGAPIEAGKYCSSCGHLKSIK